MLKTTYIPNNTSNKIKNACRYAGEEIHTTCSTVKQDCEDLSNSFDSLERKFDEIDELIDSISHAVKDLHRYMELSFRIWFFVAGILIFCILLHVLKASH